MRLIARPLGRGQRCAVTNTTQDKDGFFHTNQILAGWDQEVLVSARAAKEMARQLGWHSPEEVKEAFERVEKFGVEIDALKEKLAAYEQIVELKEKVLA